MGKVKPLKGLAGEKSSSLRCGIFPRQTLRNPDTGATLQVRNRNTGSKSRSREDMKLQIIENACKQAVTLLLLAGIILLAEKGIVPTGTIVLLFLSGGIISLLFRSVGLLLKLAIVWLTVKTFV